MTPEVISHPPRPSCAGASRGALFVWPTRPCPLGGRLERGLSRRRGSLGLRHSCDQFLVGEALADGGSEHAVEAVQGVVPHVTVPEAKSKLADIAMQVLRRGMVIDAVQPALEQREHALDAVRGHIAAHILASTVVDGFVPIEQPAHAIVDAAFVGVNRRADLNMAVSEADSIAPGDAGANLCLNASALALTTGDNGSLADASTAKVQPLAFVLRSLFSADVGFVNFHDACQFGRVVAASLAEPLEHEPRGFLRDADLRVKLDAADALARGDEQVHGVEPFVQRHLGPLKDGARADREIEQTGVATIEATLADANALRLAASGAGGPVRPAPRLEIDAGAFLIGEHAEHLECADGGFTHRASNLPTHLPRQWRKHRGPRILGTWFRKDPTQGAARASVASLRHGTVHTQHQRSCVVSRMIAFTAGQFVERKPVVGWVFWTYAFVQMVRDPLEANRDRHSSRFKRRLHITALGLVFTFQWVWMRGHCASPDQAKVKSRSRNWWPNQRGAGLLPVRSANNAYSALPFASKRKQRSEGLRSSVPLSSMNTPLARVENLTSIAASSRLGRNCPLHEKITTRGIIGSQVYNSQRKTTGPRFSYRRATNNFVGSTASTFYPLFTVLNRYTFNGRPNQSVIKLISVSAATDDATPVSFVLLKDVLGNLAGTPNFANYATTSVAAYDEAATTVTVTDNGQLVFSAELGQASGQTYAFVDEIYLQPGESLTFAAAAVTGTATYVTGSLVTREDQ